MTMQKLADWKPRLRAYLSCPHEAFAYGSRDCGAWAGGAVEAMTGENPHSAVAGQYKTMRGALRALKRLGHSDHVDLAASVLTEIDPMFACFGDIAVVDGLDGPALGVVTGPHIEVMTTQGRGIVPLTDARRAFRA